MADFGQEQIAIFAQNWFRSSDPAKAERFIQKLEENEPIQELASSPLLLTLLCLVFGESADFPANRSELYKEGLDILLKKWDGKRNIEREQLYKNLSLKRKEDLLSQIALITFEQKDYFFKQKTLEAYISDFIRNLPNVDSDPEILRMDSEAVLKSIEAQHGLFVERAKNIYSFSHLTFHEYFTAREIDANSIYSKLVKHINEKRWREVFLLTTGMTRNADILLLLMKKEIDNLVALDEDLKLFLAWLGQKSSLVRTSHKPFTIRFFYFNLAHVRRVNVRTRGSTLVFDRPLDRSHSSLDCSLDRALILSLKLAQTLASTTGDTRTQVLILDLVRSLDRSLKLIQGNKLHSELQQLRNRLSQLSSKSRDHTQQSFERLWIEKRQIWSDKLGSVLLEHRNIGQDWQVSNRQKKLLRQYYDANKLLVDCLNSDCYVSRDVRQEIEDTLLLPLSEIDRDRISST
ncbi:MAG: hypothetical protein LH702_23985 [Phormidesmis sp. CAN_BIN44]|nr:hypothetical protein [Phormidesmis sp. CAN_BIN44]